MIPGIHLGLSLLVRVFAQDGSVKQIFEEVDRKTEVYKKGSYWLFKAKENKIYMVDPEEKTYTEIPVNAVMQLTQGLGKLVKIKINGPEVKVEKLGNETILGFNCSHYKIVMDYEMEVKIAIIKSRSREHQEREIWGSPAVKGLLEVGEAFRNKDFKTGFEGLDELIAENMKAEKEIGFPLRIKSTTFAIDKKGNSTEKSKMEMEVTAIEALKFSNSEFEIPDGFEEKSMFGGE